jgi:excinuclease UvrABC nuclease subunit
MATKKIIPFTKEGAKQLPSEKPGTYKIKDPKNKLLYVGETGRLKERIEQHIKQETVKPAKDKKVEVQRTSSKAEAQAKEKVLIKKLQPPKNKKGK